MNIEEKAVQFCDETFGSDETLGQTCFCAGAYWMKAQMGWRPISELPDDDIGCIVLMHQNDDYAERTAAWFNNSGWEFIDPENLNPDFSVYHYTHFIILPDKPVK